MRINPDRIGRACAVIVCLLAVAALAAQHYAVFHETWSDENIHMYVASRVADGASLYGEIPSARPPLAIAPLAGLIALGAPPLLAARIALFASALLTAGVLLFAGRRLWGKAAGVSAFVLYLFSSTLASRMAFTGMSFVELWASLCLVLAILNRPLLAGLAAGAALMTGQHAAVIILLSLTVVVLQRPKSAALFAAGSVAVVAGIVGVVLAKGGTQIWTDLVGHHLYHAASGVEAGDERLGFFAATSLLENLYLLLPAAIALVLGKSERHLGGVLGRLRLGSERVIGIVVAAQIAVVVVMKGGQILYVQPAFPLLAMLAGAGIGRVVETVPAAEEAAEREARVRLVVSLSVCAAVAIVAGWAASSFLYGTRDKRDYSLVPALRAVEMAELQRPTVADKIAAFARERVSASGTIFGHATIADLVALKIGRRISGDLADFAPRWLELGIVSRESVVRRIEADDVELFVTPNWFWAKDEYFAAYLRACYEEPTIFPRESGSGIPRILVFVHKKGSRSCRPEQSSPR